MAKKSIIAGRGPDVPGTGTAIGTFLLLGLGVMLWWILDTFMPQLGTFVRGGPRQTQGGSIFDLFTLRNVA